ncbi:hypothetical protein ACFL23_04705 [Patescibacteria group bacterium]
MLKIKKIKLNGFRGILHEKELDCSNESSQTNSLVLYGPNSTGKTSFVDGIEWFLSPSNQINWLRRDQAKEAAYPHHEAKKSFVEIEFKKDKANKTLRKTFNHTRKTVPELTSEEDFEEVYNSFVIKPYLRYQEIVEFVFNSTGVEKYKKLAEWMGFEYELSFQKKLAEIVPNLDEAVKEIESKIESTKTEITSLSDNTIVLAEDPNISQYANALFARNEKTKKIIVASVEELNAKIPEIEKLQIQSELSKKLSISSEAKIQITTKIFSDDLIIDLINLKEDLTTFKKTEGVSRSVDMLSLYTQAQSLLSEDKAEKVPCPICHKPWKKEELIAHIKKELSSLEIINIQREELSRKIRTIKTKVATDYQTLTSIISKVAEIKEIISIATPKTTKYQTALDEIYKKLNIEQVLDSADISVPNAILSKEVAEEKAEIIKNIQTSIKELKPSEEEEKLSKNIEKLKKLSELWKKFKEYSNKNEFYKKEVAKFKAISDKLNEIIKQDIQNRFDEVSELIRKYFGKLRTDKDIKDIQITYNISGRADSRSAEIELLYYDIEVRPAYKVLSESLLSSLGLSVYFACLKKFNTDTKFIILDDVINSLDGQNRPNLIEILMDEFSNYQIILFTHDRLWFDYIKQRCPDWIKKKIIDWSYDSGPQIGLSLSKKEELDEKLKDDTHAESVGRDFGEHVEGRLNQLAENLEAQLKHRYTRQDPPALKELFDSLSPRLKKLQSKGAIAENHPIMKNISNASSENPFIRNVCSHDRRHYEGFVTAQEVKQIVDQWFADIEPILQCVKCNKMIFFNRKANKVTCPCGHIDLTKVK